MQQLLGRKLDIEAEQAAVFAHDWSSVDAVRTDEDVGKIDFRRLYAKRVDGFEPERWGMLAFSKAGSRDSVLEVMGGKSIYVVHFCSPNNRTTNTGGEAIAQDDLGRVLGIAEIGPIQVSSEMRVDPDLRQAAIQKWGSDRWPYGLEMKRAWRFLRPPLSRSTLVDHANAGWPATNSVVELSLREVGELAQHPVAEIPVYGQNMEVPAYIPPVPALHTYMVVCSDQKVLAGTKAEKDKFLVKIGVSNDRERRLQELNGNHIAVIFGVKFDRYAEGTWPTQSKSLEVERRAHDWCHANATHASGEYFYLNETQMVAAGTIVRMGR